MVWRDCDYNYLMGARILGDNMIKVDQEFTITVDPQMKHAIDCVVAAQEVALTDRYVELASQIIGKNVLNQITKQVKK